MDRVYAWEAATFAATPEQIYAVISDYRHHHPQILPSPYFDKLEVEEGGQGAGTVFRAEMNVFGVKQAFRMRVTEPEPGRKLVESDLGTDLVTTFSIKPTGDARQTELEIATNWTPKPGLAGWIERATAPTIMRMIYRKELRKLAAYLQQINNATSAAQF
jgi:hypothetical protein